MSELLSVENLSVRIKNDKIDVVRSISFRITTGETLVLLGQSGSGKSMTCRAVMGLLDPKHFNVSGEIHYLGNDLLLMAKDIKRKIFGGEIAFIPQNPMTAFDPSMRIEKQMDETLKLHSSFDKIKRKELIVDSLQHAGLNDFTSVLKSYPHMLSGGMLQRVMIAMALMSDAKLIIADEPTTALDVVHRNETIDEFLKLQKNGVAIFMVTHDFAAASRLGGNLCIMKDGELIEHGDLNDILSNPKHDYTKALIVASSLSGSTRRNEFDD